MSTLKVDDIQEQTASGGVTVNSDLTVAGSTFTSRGIDDNQTSGTEGINIGGSGNVTIGKNLDVTSGTFTSRGIDDNADGTSTGISIMTGGHVTCEQNLTVDGAFTSQGIDDNATATQVTVSDTTTTIGNTLDLNTTPSGAPMVVAWWTGTVDSDASSTGVLTTVATTSNSTSVTAEIDDDKLKITYPDTTADPCVMVTTRETIDIYSITEVTGTTEVVIEFPNIATGVTGRKVYVAIISTL